MKSLVYVLHIIMYHLLKECSLECTHYYMILEESLETFGTELMPQLLPLSMNVIENYPFYNSTKNMKVLRDNKDCILDFKCDSSCQMQSSTSCLKKPKLTNLFGTNIYIPSITGAKDGKMERLRSTIVDNDIETKGPPTTQSTTTLETSTTAKDTEAKIPLTTEIETSVGITKDTKTEDSPTTQTTTSVETTTTAATDTETEGVFTSESTGTGNSNEDTTKKVADTLAVDIEPKVNTINNTDQSLSNDKIKQSAVAANNMDKKEVAKIAAVSVIGASGMSALAYFIGKKVLHLLQYGTYHLPDPNPINTQV